MTEEQITLARRAVASKGWRWKPGMAVQAVLTNGAVEPVVGIVVGFMDVLPSVWWPDLLARRVHHPTEHLIPDLTDPATLGCLLALVREAWGNKHLWVDVGVDPAMWSLTVYSLGWACVNGEGPPPDIQAESEAGVLVAALEAAP